jgi:predicted metal-dependent enzyme (double-stranded beta helix superfamily)
VLVVRGEATEVSFSRSGVELLIPERVERLAPGSVTVSADSDVHLVGNFSSPTSDLVTLHCYSPPLEGMRLYDQGETFLADYADVTTRAVQSGCYECNQ